MIDHGHGTYVRREMFQMRCDKHLEFERWLGGTEVDDSLSASSSMTYQNQNVAAVDGMHNALLLPCAAKLSEVQLLLSLVKSPNPLSGHSLRPRLSLHIVPSVHHRLSSNELRFFLTAPAPP